MSFYDSVSCAELHDYAIKAGIGEKIPSDFIQFKKYLKKEDRILEIGCGTGRIGKLLIKDYTYTGIDNHKPYLDFFKNYLQKNKKNDDLLVYSSFEDYTCPGEHFDVIIFSWTVIGDFSKNKQLTALKKAKKLLKKGGMVLIDNPAKGTVYNKKDGYNPCYFYFDDWKTKLADNFVDLRQILYCTKSDRSRELVILKK